MGLNGKCPDCTPNILCAKCRAKASGLGPPMLPTGEYVSPFPPCPHGFHITALCPWCNPLPGTLPVGYNLGAWANDFLMEAINEQAQNPPVHKWTAATADTPGAVFSPDLVHKAYNELTKAYFGFGPLPPAPPGFDERAEPDVYHIGFMSAADVAEVRRAIGV